MIEIKIDKISPHPKNPRKDLGDLTELTDSIRTFGILQNLTVVPDGKGYTVICGHRRLAAAEAAGLKMVPCIIAEDMDEKTQVSIMLLENMQRSDLTVQEEAQGLQMMLDLGSSIQEIVKETGLSETKVRHRVKMNELDQDLLADKLMGQININDLIKLEQIRDIDTRNLILETIGTNNFEWELNKALTAQKRNETVKLIKQFLPDAEIKEGYYWQYRTFGKLEFGADQSDVADFLVELKDKEEELQEAAFILQQGNSFVIGFENDKTAAYEPDLEEEKRREEREERREKLEEMRDRIIESWEVFMEECCRHSESWFSSKQNIILDTMIENICDGDSYREIEPETVCRLMGRYEETGYLQLLVNRRWATMAAMTYSAVVPGRYEKPWGYSSLEYYEDHAKNYIATAEYIQLLGYKLSDEEDAFLDGTCELYRKD